MSPERLTDSGGSSTGRVQGQATAQRGIASAVHTTDTLMTMNGIPYLSP